MKLSKASAAVLAVQLVLVSAAAGTYLYQRWRSPRVWTRTVFVESELPMRGRYLNLTLAVDGCRSTLPTALMAEFPRNLDGTTRSDGFSVRQRRGAIFPAELKVESNRLVAIRLQNPETPSSGVQVEAMPGAACADLRLARPVSFYIPEHASVPRELASGEELWVEVSVPAKGAPRPLQLALKQNGAWKPLALR